MSLPPLYERWVSSWLSQPPAPEPLATCDACAMRAPPGVYPGGSYFHPDTKCCTFIPDLPNFLVGRILLEDPDDPSSPPGVVAAGQESTRQRIADGLGVTPLGIEAPRRWKRLYEDSRAFGTAPSLKCPHFLPGDSFNCSIWKNRASVCATWHCKYERAKKGWSFWTEALHPLLRCVERDLAQWCLERAGLPVEKLWKLFPPDPARAEGRRLTPEDLEGHLPLSDRMAIWGDWLGHEEDFFAACAEEVEALAPDEVLWACSPETRLRASMAASALRELGDDTLPATLSLSPFTMIEAEGGKARLQTYSRYQLLEVPAILLAALPAFDGRPVAEITAELQEQLHLELPPETLARLVDFGLLEPGKPSALRGLPPGPGPGSAS